MDVYQLPIFILSNWSEMMWTIGVKTAGTPFAWESQLLKCLSAHSAGSKYIFRSDLNQKVNSKSVVLGKWCIIFSKVNPVPTKHKSC